MENGSDPFIFIAGQIIDKNAAEVGSMIKGLKFLMLYCQAKYHPLFLNHSWNFHLRSSLFLRKPSKIISRDPAFEIKPIKPIDLFKQCTWYKERSELHGTGYALCNGSKVYQ
jgi:hypothetical protein